MSKIQDRIATQMESATLCATCALRADCDKAATRNLWQSINQACKQWVKWNE